MIKKLSIIFSIASTVVSNSALAATPYNPDLVKDGNRWTITAYDDSSISHRQWATQGLCFYHAGTRGTHQLYYWVSDTFPDWNGRAVQEGDQVFMHGDYARDVGHDGMQWQLTTASTKDEGFGHWHEWRENGRYGRTIGFANSKLNRVGQCRYRTFPEAINAYFQLELKANDKGEKIVTPNGLTERMIEELEKQNENEVLQLKAN